MNTLKYNTLGKKLFALMSALAVAVSLGFFSASAALADSNDMVNIKGTGYEVKHDDDGKGPYININGVRYYLQDNKVVFMGVTYTASGEGDHHDSDHHESD